MSSRVSFQSAVITAALQTTSSGPVPRLPVAAAQHLGLALSAASTSRWEISAHGVSEQKGHTAPCSMREQPPGSGPAGPVGQLHRAARPKCEAVKVSLDLGLVRFTLLATWRP